MESHLKPGWKLFLSTSWRKRELVNADKSAFKCLYPGRARDERNVGLEKKNILIDIYSIELSQLYSWNFSILDIYSLFILNFSQFKDFI